MNELTIIIVNWNTGDFLARCLESLAQLPERDVINEVMVVDNASTDTSLVKAQTQTGASGNRPRVRFIKLERNAGFARANNIALQKIQERGDPTHVLLLNPDTEVTPGALTSLLAPLSDPAVGIVGAKLLNADGTVQPSVRSFPTLGVFAFFFLKLQYLWPEAPLWRHYMQRDFDSKRQQQVEQVMGAALLARHEMIQSIGLLDERFWIWFEEVDWCQRAVQAGWKVVYAPASRILHRGGVSFDHMQNLRKTWQWSMSSLRYAHKHLGAAAAVLLMLLLPVTLLLAAPVALVRRFSYDRTL